MNPTNDHAGDPPSRLLRLATCLALLIPISCVGPAADEGEGEGATESETDAGTSETEGSDETELTLTDELGVCDEAALRHAPPPLEIYAGIMAEPMDVLSVDASFVIDVTQERMTASATLSFRAGEEGYAQLFDLRQEVTALELDGQPLDLGQLAKVIVDPVEGVTHLALGPELEPCSEHVLRVEYEVEVLGNGGLRYGTNSVFWGADFDDLHSGFYLERWAPSGLAFDQLDVEFDIELRGASGDHAVLTSGAVTELDAYHWRINWVDVAPFAPFFHLDDTSLYRSFTGIHEAPDGAQIPYEIWVEAPYSMATAEAFVGQTLASIDQFVSELGAYPHPTLRAVLGEVPGMEYAGAFTASQSAIHHEAYHQWWGRGLGPARGRDGWFDEAWTMYMTGGNNAAPLSFENDAPALLRADSPYAVETTTAAYSTGNSFFVLLAGAVGEAELHAAMNELRVVDPLGRVDSEELERHLYCALGEEPVVREAFGRWVYGSWDVPDAVDPSWCQ